MTEQRIRELDAEELVGQLNALVEELEGHPDVELRDNALDLVQLIMQLYGEALRRVLATIDSVPLKDQILGRMLGDEIIRAILLIHGLLPVDLHDRVAAAIDGIRPYLVSQGADVELLGVEDGRARLRVIRSGRGAPPIQALKLELEDSLAGAAPDLLGVDVEGFSEQAEASGKPPSRWGSMIAAARNDQAEASRLVQIKMAPDSEAVDAAWVPIVRTAGFEEGQFKAVSFGGINVLVCKIAGEFHAYRSACASGERALDDALFENPFLTCTCHGYRYDLRRRGACVERPELRLASLPVRIEEDKVKVGL